AESADRDLPGALQRAAAALPAVYGDRGIAGRCRAGGGGVIRPVQAPGMARDAAATRAQVRSGGASRRRPAVARLPRYGGAAVLPDPVSDPDRGALPAVPFPAWVR